MGSGIIREGKEVSDNWIQFVPADPLAQPTKEAADRSVQLLKSYAPDADEVIAEFKDHTEFFHPAGNWSGVQCPVCGSDAESWWGDAVSRAAEAAFSDLAVQTPCCGSQT